MVACGLGVLFGVAIVMLIGVAAGTYLWIEQGKTEGVRHLSDVTNVIARDLASRVDALQRHLRDWAKDPQVSEGFLTASPEELQAREQDLARRIPDAQRVQLVKVGVDPGDSQRESLSYAGLDLIKQAERNGRVTQLEVHRLGIPGEHLAIAAPVLAAGTDKVVGVAHVTLPTTLLPAVADAGGARGRIGFQQTVGDQAVTLESAGGPPVPTRLPDVQAPVRGTSLRVAAWVEGEGATLDQDLLLGAGIAYLVLMAIVLPALALPILALRRALIVDLSSIVAVVDDVVNKKPLRAHHCRLAETEPVLVGLSGLLRGFASNGKKTPQAEADVETVEPPAEPPEPPQPEPAAEKAPEPPPRPRPTAPELPADAVPAHIFRAYDIRGIVGTDLTPELMTAIGRAVGTEAGEMGDRSVIVGRDTRATSDVLCDALVTGLRKSGRDVLDLGVVPVPLVYFATRYQGETSGVMVTGSHNPSDYNGLKVVIGGVTLAGERIQGLRRRILGGHFAEGDGGYGIGDLVSHYVDHVERDIAIARTLKVVVDCGNATAAAVAPQLYNALGCDLVELDCDLEHGQEDAVADPSRPECLAALQSAVVAEGADLGLAFDGDADRLGVVDSSGKIIWPDRVLMLLAADVLSRHPGTDVIFDVKSSHHLATEILRHGGHPVMWKSGHAPLKAKLQETGALLAGEWSGHIIFRERWFGFDDAIYSGARLLEVLALDPRPTAEVFAALPEAVGTPELILPLPEGESSRLMQAVLSQAGSLKGVDLYTEDGLRADAAHGWGLVRASNTQPALTFRFEGDDEAGLAEVQQLFRGIMERAAPKRELPF